MSRGGRGGFGRVSGQPLPFDVDAALETEVNANRDNQREFLDDDWVKVLYPPTKIYPPPPPSVFERRLVSKYRQHRTAMRNGPFFIDDPTTGKRDPAEFNAFEEVSSYGNKRARRSNGLPNLKKVPMVKELLPPELWDVVAETGQQGTTTKKNLAFLKKRQMDKLARFDDGADVDAAVNVPDDYDEANEGENDGQDALDVPQDDDFSEDDEDLNNDYNAEKYFDDGDDGDDDVGGDEGGDEGW